MTTGLSLPQNITMDVCLRDTYGNVGASFSPQKEF